MSICSEPLTQAREALISFSQQKTELLTQIREQARKISDLEREVQRQATRASNAEEALNGARIEIQALRTMVPDDATISAFNGLVEFLSTPSQSHPELRIAA